LQVGDTGPVESARRSNSRVLGSPFSGLSGQMLRPSSTSARRQGTSLQFVLNLEFELTIDYLSSKVPGSVGWNF
jgi:hypothetical protein